MEYLLMFLAVFGLGVYVPIACIRRYLRNVRGAELDTPLLRSSIDHRVAAIIREAESGASECSVCGFANFKRFSCCALCGTALHASDAASDGSSKRATAWKSVNKKTRSSIEIVTVPLDHPVPSHAALTKRQMRARKRNEWTRTLDANKAAAMGKDSLVWTRNELQGAVDLRFPGFVLHFQHEPQRQVPTRRRHVSSEESIDINNDSVFGTMSSTRYSSSSVRSSSGSIHDATGNEELRAMPIRTRPSYCPAAANRAKLTKEQRLQELLDATADISVKVIDASVVGATRFPLEQQPALSPSFASELEPFKPHWDELLCISTQPFPTKYAHFVTATSALFVPPEKDLIRFHVNRATLFADSVKALSAIPESSIRSLMRIQFLDEPGIDVGGLHREWFALFTQALVDPTNGVFRCVTDHDHSLYVNRASVDDGHMSLAHFAAGRLIGRALLEGHVLGFHLALPLLKLILGIPVSFTDLEHFDPGLFKSLLWMLDHDGVDSLGLDFSIMERRTRQQQADKEVVMTDLIRNGHKIEVTDDNKDFYVERRFHYLLFESVATPLYVFLKGIYEVIPQELLMLLDPEELDYLLCGSDTIDVDDWQRHTKCSDNLVAHPVRDWFWESVRAMSHDHRRKLLQFATGSSRVPIAGFRALTSSDGKLCPFTLNGVPVVAMGLHAGRSLGYVRSHACFNQLDLPLHDTRHEFRAALLAAIESGDVFGFTTS